MRTTKRYSVRIWDYIIGFQSLFVIFELTLYDLYMQTQQLVHRNGNHRHTYDMIYRLDTTT